MMDFKKIRQFKFTVKLKLLNTEDDKEGEKEKHVIELYVEDKPFAIIEAVAMFRKMQKENLLLLYIQKTYENSVFEVQEILNLTQIESSMTGVIASKVVVPEKLPIDKILLGEI